MISKKQERVAQLRNKSEFNTEAAELLIDSNVYAPSVHCSYYAVFQLIKHFFVKYKEITYLELSEMNRADGRTSHKYLIEEYYLYLSHDSECSLDRREIRNLQRKTGDLRHFRVKSDYENLTINHYTANKALSISKEIIEELKRARR